MTDPINMDPRERELRERRMEIEGLINSPGFKVFRDHVVMLMHNRIEQAINAKDDSERLNALALARGLRDALDVLGINKAALDAQIAAREEMEKRQKEAQEAIQTSIYRGAIRSYVDPDSREPIFGRTIG